MQGFVRSREGRAASPLQRGPQNANISRRQLIASNARIGVPPTQLSSQHARQPSQPTSREQSVHGRMAPPPKPSSQHIKQEDQGHTGSQRRDTYDTDAESLDTTIHSRGEARVEDSQLDERGIPFAQHANDRNEYSGSEAEGSEADEGEESEEEAQEPGNMFSRAVQLGVLQRGIFHGDQSQLLGADDSYPTTTSGRLDDDEAAEEPPSSDPVDDENLSQAQTQDQERKHTSPDFQPSQPIAQGQREPLANPRTIYQRGEALRQANRPNANLTIRQVAPPLEISRPRSEPTHKKNVRYRPDPFHQAGHLIPQSVQNYSSDRPRHARNESAVSTVTGAHPHHVPASDFTNEEDERSRLEDYEIPELCKMSYDELKSQSLDYDPRAPPSVIPDNMMHNPLSERLEFVQHHLEAQDQRKFFDSLPLREWEEAGDWFAEQFSGIIKKITEARRKKRKLAMDFEVEVEKRHEHVAKRQQMVEDEMRKMRASGQGLLPKTPKKNA